MQLIDFDKLKKINQKDTSDCLRDVKELNKVEIFYLFSGHQGYNSVADNFVLWHADHDPCHPSGIQVSLQPTAGGQYSVFFLGHTQFSRQFRILPGNFPPCIFLAGICIGGNLNWWVKLRHTLFYALFKVTLSQYIFLAILALDIAL